MPQPFCVYNKFFSSQSLSDYHIIDRGNREVCNGYEMFVLGVAKIYKSGDFCGSPFPVQRLVECKDDIKGHLQSCQLSR